MSSSEPSCPATVTTKAFEKGAADLKELKRDCQTWAREFELTVKDNSAELEALGKAKAILLNELALVQTHTSMKDLAVRSWRIILQ